MNWFYLNLHLERKIVCICLLLKSTCPVSEWCHPSEDKYISCHEDWTCLQYQDFCKFLEHVRTVMSLFGTLDKQKQSQRIQLLTSKFKVLSGVLGCFLRLKLATCRANPGFTLSWRRTLSYRNQSTDFHNKSMDWFLYDGDLHHERVKGYHNILFWYTADCSILC